MRGFRIAKLKWSFLVLACLLSIAMVLAACEEMGETPGPGGAPGAAETPRPADTPSVGVMQPGLMQPVQPSTHADVLIQATLHPQLGMILTDGVGRTVYMLERDQKGRSSCYDTCASEWPPVIADEEKVAPGPGVSDPSLVGTIQRDDGKTQATYNGRPLYYYQDDVVSGETFGHNIQDEFGRWWALTPQGEAAAQQSP